METANRPSHHNHMFACLRSPPRQGQCVPVRQQGNGWLPIGHRTRHRRCNTRKCRVGRQSLLAPLAACWYHLRSRTRTKGLDSDRQSLSPKLNRTVERRCQGTSIACVPLLLVSYLGSPLPASFGAYSGLTRQRYEPLHEHGPRRYDPNLKPSPLIARVFTFR